jgi:hypothetical protein
MAMSAMPALGQRIALLVLHGGRDDIVQQLVGWSGLDWYERSDALIERASTEEIDAVVVALEDENGRSIARTITEIVARRPSVPIIVYDRIDGATLPGLLAVFGVGLRMECVARPYEPIAASLRRVTAPDYRPGVAPLLLLRFVPHAPRPLQLFVALAALAAPGRHGVDEISRRCAVSLRTIERRLTRAHWPAARLVLHSFIALDAVWLMSEYGWSARRVQAIRRFPHASSVTRLLARYAGVRPATLREDGGLPAALDFVGRALLPEGSA